MTATEIVCPDRPTGRFDGPCLALGGGIVGCRDWQADAITMLPNGLTVFNPRQRGHVDDRYEASQKQIGWEVEHFGGADADAFWFSDETVQPIALLEFGRYVLGSGKQAFVGASPAYPRRRDVVIQLGYARPAMTVYETLAELCDAVTVWYKRFGEASGR